MKKYPQKRTFPEEYTLVVPDDCLRFDSKFESGNLRRAIRVNDREYNLYLEFDIETKGYTQWFYFCVSNCKIGQSVRFNIVNLIKYESLYNNGMKPLVFSEKSNRSWHRDCSAVSYYKNNIPRSTKNQARYYYTLTFTYHFKHSEDRVFFAHCYPYTYTDLSNYLSMLSSSHYSKHVRIDTLCQTLTGNNCPVITITNNVSTYVPWEDELKKMQKSSAGRRFFRQKEARLKDNVNKKNGHDHKKCVVLTARVHPGESNGSYMMKGAIEFLIGDSKEAKILRKKFLFKVIPMLNPDGVIYGNYRCSLLGVDLNRRWKHPNKLLHPEVYYCKRLIQMISEEREVLLYCDMHGHSIKKDVFMYGCTVPSCEKQNTFIKILPYTLSRKNKIFSYKNCAFRVNKDKTATGRVVCFNDIGILCSYTMEASFYGPSHQASLENREPEIDEPAGNSHMDINHLEAIGEDFCKQLLIFIHHKKFTRKLKEISNIKPPSKKNEPLITKSSENDLETEENDENEEYEEYDLNNMIEGIDQEIINKLHIHDNNDSCESDSAGSDNDDKKIKYKEKKIIRSIKTSIKPEKSFSKFESKKKSENSISNLRPSSETPQNSKSSSIRTRNNKIYPSDTASKDTSIPYRFFSATPEFENKPGPLTKALQVGNAYKQGLKAIPIVKIVKENEIFKNNFNEKLNSLQEKKNKNEKSRDKSEIARTKVKFKEVMMSMGLNIHHRNIYNCHFK